MAATVSTSSLGHPHQVVDKIAEAQHPTSVPGSASTCQVCGAPASLCDRELLQQAASALLGVPSSVADGALCDHCSNVAAQVRHLHAQLQELSDQLRSLHIRTLYVQLENRDSVLNASVHACEDEPGPDVDERTCRLCAERLGSSAALLRHLRTRHGAAAPSGVDCSAAPCRPCAVCRCGQAAVPAPGCSSPAPDDDTGPDRSAAASPAVEDSATCRPSLPSDTAARPHRLDSALQRRRHQRQAHPPLLAYVCKLCAKRFPSPSKLRIHEDSHAGARPHACEVCGRRYHSAQKLQVHTRSHTGERPFVCHVCGRTFASAAYLAQHELTHTGRRPHQCRVCGKQFTQRGTMTKHMRNVHAELPGQLQTATVTSAAHRVATMTHISVHRPITTQFGPPKPLRNQSAP